MKDKRKTLGDYFEWGEHELVAFVKGNNIHTKENGNYLGESYLGVIHFQKSCTDESFDKKEDGVKFYYKKESPYPGDSDIMYSDFSLNNSEVKSEVPLGISTSFFNNFHFKKRTKEFKEAKKLLQKYGMY